MAIGRIHEDQAVGNRLPATVLVAEDDRISSQFIQAMLVEAGYGVRGVSDGEQCLAAAGEMQPDVILLDVVMPRLDGIQACRRLKEDDRLRQIPVIFVTGSTDDETLQAAFAAGGSDYVRKPVGRVELLARVGSALTQRRAIQKLKEEQKRQGMLETAGGLCHELNQPLQYVLGLVQVLMMDLDPADLAYAQLNTIRAQVEQMGEMTRKLADITCLKTRKYVGDVEIVDLSQSILHSRRGSKDSDP